MACSCTVPSSPVSDASRCRSVVAGQQGKSWRTQTVLLCLLEVLYQEESVCTFQSYLGKCLRGTAGRAGRCMCLDMPQCKARPWSLILVRLYV